MAAISGGRANDERVKCLRIFADGNGETHMEDIDITLQPRKLFKDNPPLRLTDNLPASWYNVCYVPTGVGETGWRERICMPSGKPRRRGLCPAQSLPKMAGETNGAKIMQENILISHSKAVI